MSVLPVLAGMITNSPDLYLIVFGFFHGLLTNLGLRERRRYWGTVYDSVTKQPLDPVIVKLVDAKTGREVDTALTDIAGRFGFLIKPGSYYIRTHKTHYAFPSSVIKGQVDGIFTNLYHGGHLTINIDSDVLSPNIPMDPQSPDWNQLDKQRIVRFHPWLEKFVPLLLQTLFWGGAVFALMRLIIHPTPLTLLLLGIYLLFAVLRTLVREERIWGRVIGSSQPVGGLYLEVSPIRFPGIISNATTTTADGKFFLMAPPGKYLLRVKTGPGNATSQIAQRPITVRGNGVVNDDIHIGNPAKDSTYSTG